jgi:hypothetical protein
MDTTDLDPESVPILVRDYLVSLIGADCDRSTYTDLDNEIIGKLDTELESCQKKGKSNQKVYVCGRTSEGYVYKAQSKEFQRIISGSIIDEKIIVKVDSFTMNLIMQQMMRKIVEEYPDYTDNIEHPITDICNDNDHLLLIYNKSNGGDFQDYLSNNTHDADYLENITSILNRVMDVNDMLYNLCQFQHCDMKCMQILLKNDGGKIIPILSDFDKSTATFLIKGIAVRFILKKLDSVSIGKKVSGTDLFEVEWRVDGGGELETKGRSKRVKRKYSKRVKRKYSKRVKRKCKINKTIKKKKNTKKKIKGGSSKGKILSNKLANLSPRAIRKAVGGKQFIQRFNKKPLNNNNFYNACLLASTLLLCDNAKNLYEHLVQNLKKSYLLNSLDLKRIEKLNHKNKNNTGNQIAADMVNDSFIDKDGNTIMVESNTLYSSIIMV